MHRLLRKQNLQGERRAQRAPQSNLVPRLLATAPHQVWTWDIAKLPTRKRSEYLSLYVVMVILRQIAKVLGLVWKEQEAIEWRFYRFWMWNLKTTKEPLLSDGSFVVLMWFRKLCQLVNHPLQVQWNPIQKSASHFCFSQLLPGHLSFG